MAAGLARWDSSRLLSDRMISLLNCIWRNVSEGQRLGKHVGSPEIPYGSWRKRGRPWRRRKHFASQAAEKENHRNQPGNSSIHSLLLA